jgi:hypothetical protein
MEFNIPEPLRREHEELHGELRKATKEGGFVGDAAKALAELMHPHFLKEDTYALPPLGLLPLVAKGAVTPGMAEVLKLTDQLQKDLGQMLAEHRAIVAALRKLADSARREDKPEYVTFAEKLIAHAETEELVMYPTALLIGEYVRLKLGIG